MCTLGGWPVSRGAPSISKRNDEFYRDLLLLEFFLFRKLLLSNGRNDDIVSSIESIHRGNSICREKGINDTKFKQTRR